MKNRVVACVMCLIALLSVGTVIYFEYYYKPVQDEKEVPKESLFVDVIDEDVINSFLKLDEDRRLYNVAKLERDIDNFNSIAMFEKLNIGFDSVKDNVYDIYESGLDVSLIEDYFKDTFNTIIYFDKEDITCECGNTIFTFDNNLNKYIVNDDHEPHDVTSIINFYTKVTNVKKKNDTYVVTYIKLWANVVDDTFTEVYSSYNDALNKTNVLYTFELEEGIRPFDTARNNFKEEYISKMPKYIFTYKYLDDNYLLDSLNYEK